MNLFDLHEVSRKPRRAKSLYERARKYIGAVKGAAQAEEHGGAGQGLGSWNYRRETFSLTPARFSP
jgi:hypothetical protein